MYVFNVIEIRYYFLGIIFGMQFCEVLKISIISSFIYKYLSVNAGEKTFNDARVCYHNEQLFFCQKIIILKNINLMNKWMNELQGHDVPHIMRLVSLNIPYSIYALLIGFIFYFTMYYIILYFTSWLYFKY